MALWKLEKIRDPFGPLPVEPSELVDDVIGSKLSYVDITVPDDILSRKCHFRHLIAVIYIVLSISLLSMDESLLLFTFRMVLLATIDLIPDLFNISKHVVIGLVSFFIPLLIYAQSQLTSVMLEDVIRSHWVATVRAIKQGHRFASPDLSKTPTSCYRALLALHDPSSLWRTVFSTFAPEPLCASFTLLSWMNMVLTFLLIFSDLEMIQPQGWDDLVSLVT